MIIRRLDDVKAQDNSQGSSEGNYQENPGVWTSTRYLLREDGVGFTLTQTTIAAGASFEMEYKNHVEANLVIEGQCRVTDIATGEVHALGPGDTYTLDKHDHHRMDAVTDLRLVCVFTPALVGTESHDADGSYPVL